MYVYVYIFFNFGIWKDHHPDHHPIALSATGAPPIERKDIYVYN